MKSSENDGKQYDKYPGVILLSIWRHVYSIWFVRGS